MSEFRLPLEKEDKFRDSELPASKCIAATYVGDFQVTTCFRQSSSMECPSWYYETFVWRMFADGDREDRELVGDATGIGHVKAVQRILNLGEWRDMEYDDD